MTSAFSLPKQIQTHLPSYKKTEAPGLSFLFLLSEGFFLSGTLCSSRHVDSSLWSNCSKKRMTSFVIGVGVDAPAVTATVLTSFSHSSFSSLMSPIR